MKNILINILSFVLLATLINCAEEEVTSREYPRLKTTEVTDISAEGATFNAEFIFRGDFEILNYGFVWGSDLNPRVETSERIFIEGDIQSSSFSKEIITTLLEGTSYHVRAFVKTEEFIVYGINQQFVSLGSQAPQIEAFFPQSGTLGDTILIKGKNFSYVENQVFFEDHAAQIVSSTDTALNVIVPDQLRISANTVSVSVKNNKIQFDESFQIVEPDLLKVTPSAARTYDTLKIQGRFIGSRTSHIKVNFEQDQIDSPARDEVISNTNNEILVVVPEKLKEDSKVWVTIAGMTDSIDFKYRRPEIISVNKTEIIWGDTLVVNVKNFYQDKSKFKILLNGSNITVLDASDTSFSCIVPKDLKQEKSKISAEIVGFLINLTTELDLKKPVIRKINVDSAAISDTIILQGENFHPEHNQIKLNSGFVNPVFNSSEMIKFIMPKNNSYSNFYNTDNDLINLLLIANNTLSTDTSITLRRPKIIDFYPKEINQLGETITITGYNFGNTPVLTLQGRNYYADGRNQYFSSQSLNILESTNSIIKFQLTKELLDEINNAEFSAEMLATLQIESFGWTVSNDDNLNYQYTTQWNLINNPVYSLESSYRLNPQVINDENFGYVIGGFGPRRTPFTRESLKDFWQFSPTVNSWTRLANWKDESAAWWENLELAFIYDEEVYGVANSGKFIKYESNSNSWLSLDALKEGNYIDYFELNNSYYVIYIPSPTSEEYAVYELDILNSKMDSVASFPFDWQEYDYNYKRNGKLRIVGVDYSQYELNPNTFEWQAVNEDIVDQRIFNYNSENYMYNNTDIYLFSPLLKMAEFPVINPNISFTGRELMFKIKDKFYFKEDGTIMYSYELE